MKHKLLLVDDDKEFAELFRKRAEASDWNMVWLSDGTDAVKVAKSEKPDVIILDVFLPETDGFTTLKSLKMKTDPETKSPSTVCNIPVVVMTGKAPMMEDMIRFEGAIEFFTKPVDGATLLKRINEIVESKQKTQKT